jgi:hypothetical protein
VNAGILRHVTSRLEALAQEARNAVKVGIHSGISRTLGICHNRATVFVTARNMVSLSSDRVSVEVHWYCQVLLNRNVDLMARRSLAGDMFFMSRLVPLPDIHCGCWWTGV